MAGLVRWTKKKQRIGRDRRWLMLLGNPLAVVASAHITERKLRKENSVGLLATIPRACMYHQKQADFVLKAMSSWLGKFHPAKQMHMCPEPSVGEKQKSMPFGNRAASLLRGQPRAKTIGHSLAESKLRL